MDQNALIALADKLRAHAMRHTVELRNTAPAVIAAGAKLVLTDGNAIRDEFLDASSTVGLSREMVREGLENAFRPLQEENLRCQLTQSIGAAQVRHPELIFHVLAGNLFVSGIESITTAMLTGAASLVRCSAADQLYPALWQQAVQAVSPVWGDAIAVTHWLSNRNDLTAAACAASDVVITFGSDESVEAVRSITPIRIRFVPHGTKVSFAFVSASDIHREAGDVARRLAYDFSVYDQQGCLSPRAAFIEKLEAQHADAFRLAFLAAMREQQVTLPLGALDLAESAALARERNEALIEGALNDSTKVWSTPEDRFVVTLRPATDYRPGSLNRFADLRVFSDRNEIETALAPYRGMTATLGLASHNSNWSFVADYLRADRICRLGDMQKPPLGWTHDGRQPLADLLQFFSADAHG